MVAKLLLPILLRERHRMKVCQGAPFQFQKMVYQIETIVIDLIICGVQDSFAMKGMLEIITNVHLEPLPKNFWLCWGTVFEDGNKEIAELGTHLHSAGFLKTLNPLIIILQKAPSDASLLESFMNHIVHPEEIIVGSGTFDDS